MKRIIVLAALLAAASACAPAEQGNSNNANLAAVNSNTATAQASPPAVSDAELIALDREIWEAIKSKNWDAFAAHLDDAAITVNDSGVYDKTQTLEGLKKMELTEYAISDTKVVKLDPDAAVLTYTTNAKGKYDGQPIPETPSRDTTVFVKRGGKWLAIFHQETMVAPPPPTASDSPDNSNAAASNSNTASPAATAAPAPASVTDAEKQVWDMLKARNWDGFAAFLTSDFVEVEPDGVTDKAGSVAGVKQVNFSSVILSDFKEVKIDGDASVITYVAKGTGRTWPPKGMRHSSAWVNRGGKWQAAFHQGTVIK